MQQPKTETEESLTAEVRKLQNEKRSTDIKIRQLELQLEQANEAKKMVLCDFLRPLLAFAFFPAVWNYAVLCFFFGGVWSPTGCTHVCLLL